MAVETRYSAGDGVLLGAGDHWVLMTDPEDDEVLDELWSVISGSRGGDASTTEQVLAIVEKAFGGDPPAVAVVDLAGGASTFVSRGRGHVHISGPDRILSLDGGVDPGPLPATRRLVGGVVSASRATLKPLSHTTLPAPFEVESPAAQGGLLIDGIPDAILAAAGPDGPPPRPRRRGSPEPGHDTGSLSDTTEPDPGFVERISQGAHTTIQPPMAERSGVVDDHDGSTVHRPVPSSHLRHGTSDTVLAVSCASGHLTPPDSRMCRVCRQPVAPQEPRRVPRPPLGGLRLPTGEVVPLDRGVVLGRKPAPLEDSTDWPHLVHLPSDHTFVSRMHLHIELDGWLVLARDLDSRGGTMLTMPGRGPEQMRSGEAYVLEPGASLDLAEVYEVRFEVGPVVPRRSLGELSVSAPVIGGYAFVEHLGSGGFADVFLYEQQWPRQRVAVKVVRPDVPLNDREKQLFTAEANAMARLADHPYIVSVITAGVTVEGQRPYLVMRYCPPPDLGMRVRSNPMAVVDAVSTGIKLASAIETAHRSGILHRDIKPSNVLVTTYHEPALTDFGIAGHIADVEGESDVRISYPWSPPELLDGRSNGSVASDVYSLGATIWHLLVGRSPFSIPAGDNSTRALSARILHAAPPATQRSDVPPALDRLLQQCLAKNPAHRPRSALDLARSLQQIEAAANWPRTAVAVEGDRPDTSVRPAGPEPEEDRTVMKAVTVISASAPRRIATAQSEPEEPETRTSALVWTGVGVVATAVLLGALVLTDGDRSGQRPAPTPTDTTPSPLIADSLTSPPTLSGSRAGDTVVFRWDSPDGVETGDEWLWQQPGTDDFERTRKRSVRLRGDDEVCLEVRQVRGADESPTADTCVR